MKELRMWMRSPDTMEPQCVSGSLCASFHSIFYMEYFSLRRNWQKSVDKYIAGCGYIFAKVCPLCTYLHIIWRWLIAGPLEGFRHIAKYLHRRQQVTGVEVPPLGEIQQVFCHLGHPIPCQHPLALGKVPLNLHKQEKTELGASVSSAGSLHTR